MRLQNSIAAMAAPLRFSLLLCPALALAQAAHHDPGPARAAQLASRLQLENNWIRAGFSLHDNHLTDLSFEDRLHNRTITLPQAFSILLKDGTIYPASQLHYTSAPALHEFQPQPDAARQSDRTQGRQYDADLESDDHQLHAHWALILLDGSTYIRQVLTLSASRADLPISQVRLLDIALPDAYVSGSVQGSPIVAGDFFLGLEHPLSESKVTVNGATAPHAVTARATAWIDRDLPLRAGQSITYSAVIGVARTGQLRRDFLAYLERERAHPYRTFLHYNSWYDLGYFTPYDESAALDRVNAFGRELVRKRGVQLDSYLFDDGWDDHHSLWKFNQGFPNGFTAVRRDAEKYAADPGVWMSPWGGYSKPKQERIDFGRSAGYEIVANGYALSGPSYYAAFRDVCLQMIDKYGVNQFKFDGTGNADSVFPGSQFDSDFSAAIHLIGELRAAKPSLFINLTTGTWPSPFWLMYADSIWRGGDDDNTAGVGPYRERWITYRDADTYRGIVQKGPLYPLNSLMLHGMIYAQHHKDLDKDPGNDFRNEIRSYFGTGTQLQEMYITPSLLSEANWDDLAEAAKWSRANADVLKDTHWIGGDPAWLEVYGWAAWTPQKGILVLRNPSDHPQAIRIQLHDVFELPPDAPQDYTAHSPWRDQAAAAPISLNAGVPREFRLAPFEVLTLDVIPR
jgi:hypothetical protein